MQPHELLGVSRDRSTLAKQVREFLEGLQQGQARSVTDHLANNVIIVGQRIPKQLLVREADRLSRAFAELEFDLNSIKVPFEACRALPKQKQRSIFGMELQAQHQVVFIPASRENHATIIGILASIDHRAKLVVHSIFDARPFFEIARQVGNRSGRKTTGASN